MHDGWWRARVINPSKITPDSAEMLQQLAGIYGCVNRATEGAEGVFMSKGRRVNRRRFAVILTGIKAGEGYGGREEGYGGREREEGGREIGEILSPSEAQRG